MVRPVPDLHTLTTLCVPPIGSLAKYKVPQTATTFITVVKLLFSNISSLAVQKPLVFMWHANAHKAAYSKLLINPCSCLLPGAEKTEDLSARHRRMRNCMQMDAAHTIPFRSVAVGATRLYISCGRVLDAVLHGG